jgi:hypothetical protein
MAPRRLILLLPLSIGCVRPAGNAEISAPLACHVRRVFGSGGSEQETEAVDASQAPACLLIYEREFHVVWTRASSTAGHAPRNVETIVKGEAGSVILLDEKVTRPGEIRVAVPGRSIEATMTCVTAPIDLVLALEACREQGPDLVGNPSPE